MIDILFPVLLLIAQLFSSYALAVYPNSKHPTHIRRWKFLGLTSSCLAAFFGLMTIVRSNQSTQEIVNQATGGNSWGFVMPLATDVNHKYALQVFNQGQYPLYAVHLEIIQTNPYDGKAYIRDVNVGDIAALDHRLTSPADGVDVYPEKTSVFQVYIMARNRTVIEFVEVPAEKNKGMKFRILDTNNQPIKNIVNPKNFNPRYLY